MASDEEDEIVEAFVLWLFETPDELTQIRVGVVGSYFAFETLLGVVPRQLQNILVFLGAHARVVFIYGIVNIVRNNF